MSRIFAYCRISTLDQTTENQRREIESAGFKIKPQQIIEEHISGSAATSERPGFNRLLARLKCVKTVSPWLLCNGYQENSGTTDRNRYQSALLSIGGH